jgi:hypothetical protein
MTDANDVIDIAQAELQQLVGNDAGSIAEAKETMIGEDCMKAHGSGVQDCLVAKIAERRMAMDDLNVLSNEDLP